MFTMSPMWTLHVVLCAFVLFAQANESNNAKFTRIACLSIDPEYIADTSCRIKPVRRGLYVVNISARAIQPLDNLFLRLKLFKKTNVFKPFLVDVSEDFCNFLSKKHVSPYMKVVGNVYLPYSNVNTSCPLVGEIIFKDMPMDANYMPSVWPTGDYRLDIMLHAAKKHVVTLQFFFELTERRHISN